MSNEMGWKLLVRAKGTYHIAMIRAALDKIDCHDVQLSAPMDRKDDLEISARTKDYDRVNTLVREMVG